MILTNPPRSFQKTSVFETGLSDYHSLLITVIKSHLPRLKTIKYRSYIKFDAENVFSHVKLLKLGAPDNPDQAYNDLVCTFRKLVDKRVPPKNKSAKRK